MDYNILNNSIDRNCGSLPILFPKFKRENAIKFGARHGSSWWWPIREWDTGRMRFLDWLIDEYRDNNEDLRKIKL